MAQWLEQWCAKSLDTGIGRGFESQRGDARGQKDTSRESFIRGSYFSSAESITLSMIVDTPLICVSFIQLDVTTSGLYEEGKT